MDLRLEIRPVVALATPLAIAEIGWVAMQLVDIGVVGRLGPEAIGAVGVGSALFLALGVFGMGMLAGLDPLISQAFGARRPLDCHRWLRHGLCVAVGLTVPLTLLGRAVGGHLGAWGFDADVLEMTRPYFYIVIWSLLPLLLYAALRRYLQAVNAVRPVMIVLVSANVVNAIADWMLVFGNLGAPALGVDGAAWATVVSRVYMTILLAVACARRGGVIWPMWAGVGMAGVRRLLSLGWPAAVQTALEYGVFAAATALAARLQPSMLAAHQIVLNLAGLTFMVPLGISAAGAVRVGHAVGRRDADGAARAGWTALALGAGFMTGAAVVFVAVPRPILGLFTADASVITTGVALLLLAAVFQLFDGLQGVATGALRGLGDTLTPMICNLVGHWVLGLPVGYALCFVFGWGIAGLWVGLSGGLILVGIVLVGTWHRRTRELAAMLRD